MASTLSLGSGGGSGSFGLQPQPVSGGNDDLTRYQRSLTDLLGTSGAGTQAFGFSTVQDPVNYYKGILSGNPAALAEAAAPEISATKQQYAGARRAIDQYSPRGGGRSNATTQSRYNEASDVSNIIAKQRPQAASALSDIGIKEQSLGIEELGQAISAILSKMGVNQQGSFANQFGTIVSAIGQLI